MNVDIRIKNQKFFLTAFNCQVFNSNNSLKNDSKSFVAPNHDLSIYWKFILDLDPNQPQYFGTSYLLTFFLYPAPGVEEDALKY